jgi:hypothetical protein
MAPGRGRVVDETLSFSDAFVLDVADCRLQQFDRGLVTGEVTVVLDDLG